MADGKQTIINRRGEFSQVVDQDESLSSVAEVLEGNGQPIILLSIEKGKHPITGESVAFGGVRSNSHSVRALEYMKDSLIDYIEHVKTQNKKS